MSTDETAKRHSVDEATDTPSRDSARTVLERDIRHAHDVCRRAGLEAVQLEALANSLPVQLNATADEALYNLLMAARRSRVGF